jgi:hypothetical protein
MLHITGSATVHKTFTDTKEALIPLNQHEMQNKVISAKQAVTGVGNGASKSLQDT